MVVGTAVAIDMAIAIDIRGTSLIDVDVIRVDLAIVLEWFMQNFTNIDLIAIDLTVVELVVVTLAVYLNIVNLVVVNMTIVIGPLLPLLRRSPMLSKLCCIVFYMKIHRRECSIGDT